MKMDREKKAQYKIISRIIGIILFVLMMFILNQFSITNSTAELIIGFLNNNFAFIILMSIILLVADIFYAFIIPFNLPAPIFSAFGGILIVTFIFRILGLIDTMLNETVFIHISWLRWIIYPVVFIIALISGYVSILFNTFQVGSRSSEKREKEPVNITPKKHKTWQNIGDELKDVLYDFLHKIKLAINKKRKTK
jgi:hypothetical protein